MTSNDFIFLYIVNMVKVEQAKITILMYTEMFLLINFFYQILVYLTYLVLTTKTILNVTHWTSK